LPTNRMHAYITLSVLGSCRLVFTIETATNIHAAFVPLDESRAVTRKSKVDNHPTTLT